MKGFKFSAKSFCLSLVLEGLLLLFLGSCVAELNLLPEVAVLICKLSILRSMVPVVAGNLGRCR